MHLKDLENAEVTCLVDNNVDLLLPNKSRQLSSRPELVRTAPNCRTWVSFSLKLEINRTERTLLFDSGLNPLVAAHNSNVLGLDLSLGELVISSHGHIDHAGGLLNIINKMNRKQNIPLLIHEHAFRNRMVRFHDGRMLSLPAPNRSILT